MMAFFLLMWLVSSATESQRAMIAKYFTTTSIFDLPKGNGVLDGGKAVMAGAEAKTERLTPSGKGGQQQQQQPIVVNAENDAAANATASVERQRFEALKAELEKMAHEGELKGQADNLAIDLTPEGLRIQIFDRDGEPMFASGDAEPTPRLARILEVIGEVLQTVKNGVIISGHTDSPDPEARHILELGIVLRPGQQRAPPAGEWRARGEPGAAGGGARRNRSAAAAGAARSPQPPHCRHGPAQPGRNAIAPAGSRRPPGPQP